MSKKDNFNKAVFDVFGGGSSQAEPAAENAVEAQALSTEVTSTAVAEPTQAAPYTLVPATFLAPGTTLEGKLTSKGDVEFAGNFNGEIVADGNVTLRADATGNISAASLNVVGCHLTGDCTISGSVTISDKSTVSGNITAEELSCSGCVVGDIVVRGALSLEATARITGNITAATMSMARGAVIKGELTIERE